MRNRLLVAMSGGVDSALSAALMLEAGFALEAVTLRLYDEADAVIEHAKACSEQLGLKHRVLDLRQQFAETVVAGFVNGYASGFTPNPCLICNRHIKYGAMLEYALSEGFEGLVTGHYARKHWNGNEQRWDLLKGLAVRKDQSYFLYHLTQAQLERVHFPLGEYLSKQMVRDEAKRRGLLSFEKKDSDGLCFLEGRDHNIYLQEKIHPAVEGVFMSPDGVVLGCHDGFYRFTIGQKKNLPEGLPRDSAVIAIQPNDNSVVIGPEAALYRDWLKVDELILQAGVSLPLKADIRIFNWGHTLKGRLEAGVEGYTVYFDAPVRAIVQGQHAVFFDGDRVLGGGLIVG